MITAVLVTLLTAGQAPIRLEFMPPVGKTYRYQMTMNMTMDMSALAGAGGAGKPPKAMDMGMNTSMAIRVVKRSGDVTTIETKMSEPKMTGSLAGMAGGNNALKGGKTSTSTIDRHFHIASVGGAGAQLSGAFGNLAFPNRPLRVGDTWTETVDLAKVMGAMGGGMGASGAGKLPMKFRLVRIERQGGEPVAVLAVTSDSTMNIRPMNQPMTLHMIIRGSNTVDISTGMYRDSSMVMDMDMAFQGKPMKQHMVEKMTRL